MWSLLYGKPICLGNDCDKLSRNFLWQHGAWKLKWSLLCDGHYMALLCDGQSQVLFAECTAVSLPITPKFKVQINFKMLKPRSEISFDIYVCDCIPRIIGSRWSGPWDPASLHITYCRQRMKMMWWEAMKNPKKKMHIYFISFNSNLAMSFTG